MACGPYPYPLMSGLNLKFLTETIEDALFMDVCGTNRGRLQSKLLISLAPEELRDLAQAADIYWTSNKTPGRTLRAQILKNFNLA